MTRKEGSRSEFERIAALATRFGAPSDPSIVRGIGDDAAVLAAAELRTVPSQLVWTIDAQVEGVHFREDLASWEDVGWRSFMAAASDVAAMGATPWCALSALVLPKTFDDDALEALTAGQAAAARAVGAAVVGGNLARGSEVSITTTLLGVCARAVERAVRAGDGIWVAGELGLSAGGLAALERKLDASNPEVARAVEAWRRPRARIEAGLAMAERAHGAIDVSDGLVQDLGHIAAASSVRAVLEATRLAEHVEPAVAGVARALGVSALELAMYGGEDYALVAASAVPIDGFVRIGRFESGEGVVLEDQGGKTRPLERRGFDHFR